MATKIRIFFVGVLAFLSGSAANANWSRATSDHFIVYGDLHETQIRAFAEKLERFDAVMRHVTGNTENDPGNPVTVFIVNSEEEIQRLSGDRNVAGFYHAQIWGSFAYVPKDSGGGDFDLTGQAVLFHEYAHHYMYHYYPAAYPSWFVEGFAELYATTDIARDGKATFGKPPLYRAWGLLRNDYPLNKMLTLTPEHLSAEDNDAYYGKAWLLTHYLTFEKPRSGQLGAYLSSFGKGVPLTDAANTAFGDIKKLSREVDTYLGRSTITVLQILNLKPNLANITVETLTDSQSALIPLTIRMSNGSRERDIAPFLQDARIKLAKYPQEPMALAAAAEGNLDARNLDEATRINDLLITAQPENAAAMLRRARIAAAHIGNSQDATAWAAFRKIVVRANHISNNDPYALFEYYHSYNAAGDLPPQIAIDGLSRALQLAPQADQIRIALTSEMIRLGKGPERDYLVAPMLNDPHSPSLREFAHLLKEAPLGRYPDVSMQMTPNLPELPKKK